MKSHVLLALTLAAATPVVGGCALLTTPVAAATKVGLGPKVPAEHDLQQRPAWVRVIADEALVGTAAALASDPIAVEARRSLEAHKEVVVADRPGEAERVIIAELGVPQDEEVLGSPFTSLSAVAHVRVLDPDGVELWPADGTQGREVRVKLPADARGNPADLQRQVHRQLGRAVAALFFSRREEA